MNVYTNGHAWLDGMPIPEADLKMSIACRDSGFIDDYVVNNWWRSTRYHEIVQTFVPQGAELRIAQMILAGDGGYIIDVGDFRTRSPEDLAQALAELREKTAMIGVSPSGRRPEQQNCWQADCSLPPQRQQIKNRR